MLPPAKPPRLHRQLKSSTADVTATATATATTATTVASQPLATSQTETQQPKKRRRKVLQFRDPLDAAAPAPLCTANRANLQAAVERDSSHAARVTDISTTAPAATTTATAAALAKNRLAEGCSSLMHACQQGDAAAVLQQLRLQPDRLRQRDSRNKSLLHYCAAQRQRDVMAAASIAAAAPELLGAADEDGFTPLHLAVIQGNLAMVNLLLANKADVNAVDHEGHSVVHWATVCGEVEALRSVLAAGADVAAPDINGGSPLHYAAQMCGANYEGKLGSAASSKLALEILAILLAHPQSSVDLQDKDGRQPLLWAASAGSAKAVTALVKAGARVESADKDGLTALHCAASRGHTECIDTLIGLCGTPTDLIDANGCTALHYAVTLGHADATARLLELEADANRQDRKGRTPAHCGCSKGQFETVRLLKERGANLWLRNAKGDLPVHEAASSGRRELLKWLLAQRPNQVNTTSNDGRSLLHIAAGNDHTDICKLLLDYGADVNAIYRNAKGVVVTPLDCALQKAHRSTAKFMQANGGLPASKLRLSARRANPFREVACDVVRPLKYAEKEELQDLRTSKKYVVYLKRSDSDGDEASCSCNEQTFRKEHSYLHLCRRHQRSRRHSRRRTSSCGEPKTSRRRGGDSGSDICRSKSNIELWRRRSREPCATSSEGEEDHDGDSCENCCYHKREKKRVIRRRPVASMRRPREPRDPREPKDGGVESAEGGKHKNSSAAERQACEGATKTPSASSVKSKQGRAESRPRSAASTRSAAKSEPAMAAAKDGPPSKAPSVEAAAGSDKEAKTASGAPQKELPTDEDDDQEAHAPEVVHVDVHHGADEEQSTASLKLSDDADTRGAEAGADPAAKQLDTGSAQQQEGELQVEQAVEGVTRGVDVLPAETPAEARAEEADREAESPGETLPTTERTDDTKDDGEEKAVNEDDRNTEEPRNTDDMTAPAAGGAPPERTQTPATPAPVAATPTTEEPPHGAAAPTPPSAASAEAPLPNEAEEPEPAGAPVTAKEPSEADATCRTPAAAQTRSDPSSPATASTAESKTPTAAPVSSVAAFAEASNPQREQESRRSFTLLPSDSADEEQPARKSSFQVLHSDESLDLHAERRAAEVASSEHEAEFSDTQVFKVVSRPHSAQDDDEEEDGDANEGLAAPVVDHDDDEDDDDDGDGDDNGDDSPRRRFTGSGSGSRHGAGDISEAAEFDCSSGRRRRFKKRVRSGTETRSNWRASVEERARAQRPPQASSRDQDSGFEPSPRTAKTKIPTPRNVYTAHIPRRPVYATLDGRSCSSRAQNRKPGDRNACDMTAVTRSIQRNIRRYCMERKIFQHLLELKSLQIRSNKLNEAVLVKRAVDDYHESCAALGGETGARLRRYPFTEYTFRNFELFLYETLKALQKPGTRNFQNLNEVYEEAERRLSPDCNAHEKALQCTSKTHRCLHAAHAYTGIPCAAYIPMMNHHTMPKFGFGSYKKSGVGSFYLPKILTSGASCGGRVSLELTHGKSRQLIALPAERLDSNKRYYVTFTMKGAQEADRQPLLPAASSAAEAARVYSTERK